MADVQFKNEHELTKRACKMRRLKAKGHNSDYLVRLRDLNSGIECTGQIVTDQTTDQMPSENFNMKSMMGPITIEDEQCL
jgi:hypothetical protein